MPLINTPKQLAVHAEFYRQLAQLLSAGVDLVNALEHLHRAPPSASFRKPIGRILEHLKQGAAFSESVRAVGRWMPEFDVALLAAGEQSGRLDACCRLLAGYYEERARAARQLLGDLAYPVFLLHFLVLSLPFPQLILTGNLPAYLRQTVGWLAGLYLIVFLVVFAGQGRRGERWRAFVEALVRAVPVLGTARRCLALSRLAAALEALLDAGVPIISAWEMAAAASGSPALRRTVLAWRPRLEAGETPSEAVSRSRQFPELFANFYHTGEVSGSLDEMLGRLRVLYQEDGTRKLHAVSQWVPRFIYLLVMGVIGYVIIRTMTHYYGQILSE